MGAPTEIVKIVAPDDVVVNDDAIFDFLNSQDLKMSFKPNEWSTNEFFECLRYFKIPEDFIKYLVDENIQNSYFYKNVTMKTKILDNLKYPTIGLMIKFKDIIEILFGYSSTVYFLMDNKHYYLSMDKNLIDTIKKLGLKVQVLYSSPVSNPELPLIKCRLAFNENVYKLV